MSIPFGEAPYPNGNDDETIPPIYDVQPTDESVTSIQVDGLIDSTESTQPESKESDSLPTDDFASGILNEIARIAAIKQAKVDAEREASRIKDESDRHVRAQREEGYRQEKIVKEPIQREVNRLIAQHAKQLADLLTQQSIPVNFTIVLGANTRKKRWIFGEYIFITPDLRMKYKGWKIDDYVSALGETVWVHNYGDGYDGCRITSRSGLALTQSGKLIEWDLSENEFVYLGRETTFGRKTSEYEVSLEKLVEGIPAEQQPEYIEIKQQLHYWGLKIISEQLEKNKKSK